MLNLCSSWHQFTCMLAVKWFCFVAFIIRWTRWFYVQCLEFKDRRIAQHIDSSLRGCFTSTVQRWNHGHVLQGEKLLQHCRCVKWRLGLVVIAYVCQVTLHQSHLVLRWVTICKYTVSLISVYNQPSRPTQSPALSGMRSEYRLSKAIDSSNKGASDDNELVWKLDDAV